MAFSVKRASQKLCLNRLAFHRSMSSAPAPLLLSPSEVQNLYKSPTPISVLDVTWFMPNSPRRAREEFLQKRLPGAQFMDLDEVASPHELGLKHMMPDERVFSRACEKLGITPSSHVVIYDTHGVFSSPRALFMFRSFGHSKSSIINGGLPGWVDEGLVLETQSQAPPKLTLYPPPMLDKGAIRSYEQIVSNSLLDPSTSSEAELVLDARSRGRYLGTESEPRPGLSSGHIPHSSSLPFNVFLKKCTPTGGPEYTTFRSEPEIRKALEDALGTSIAKEIVQGKRSAVTSCGSGMTAGVLWLGLKLLGVENASLYDESWTGYAMRPSSKIEKS